MRPADLLLGVALARGVIAGVRRAAVDGRRRRAARAPVVVRDARLLGLVLGCFAVGAPMVVLFEETVVRILGAVILCGFIVAGVFLVADPAFLAPDAEDDGGRGPGGP